MQSNLIEGFGNKVPKVVVGALDATLQIVRYPCYMHPVDNLP